MLDQSSQESVSGLTVFSPSCIQAHGHSEGRVVFIGAVLNILISHQRQES